VQEGNATTFDGVVGYIPAEDGSSENGFFTGLIDLSLSNLFGTGRKFGVYWKKPDRNSEEFSIRYQEPWLFGYPLDAGIGMERIVRDTTYIEWQYEVNSRIRIGENLYGVSRINRKLAFPDSSASREQNLARNSVLNLEIGLEYDNRDYPVNPRSGFYYRNTYSYGFKENFGPSYLLKAGGINKNERLETIKLSFKWFQSLISNQVLGVELNGYKVTGTKLQLTDYFWFGGSRTLRGYRENQFRGEIIAWANVEYRFLLSRNSRIFIFNDWGFFRDPGADTNQDDTLPGYGVGIRLNTGLGIMGIDYGLGRGDSFGQGKIHFGLVNRF
jgi:outer membrane protein insertion porin family